MFPQPLGKLNKPRPPLTSSPLPPPLPFPTKVILLDGGVGQELVKRSSEPPHPLWSSHVLMREPELVVDVHRAFLEAGSRFITLNTYTCTPQRLAKHGAAERFAELQQQALQLAQQARAEASISAEHRAEVAIAACLPPLCASFHPETAPAHAEAVASYKQIVQLALDGGVDVFLAETMSSIGEARAAKAAAQELAPDHPLFLSFTLADTNADDRPCLRSGELLSDAVAALTRERPPLALLVNCSRPEAITAAMATLAATLPPHVATGAYANAFESIEALAVGTTVDCLRAREDLLPAAYAHHGLAWVQQFRASIVGGCCEICPQHMRVLAARLTAAGFQLLGKSGIAALQQQQQQDRKQAMAEVDVMIEADRDAAHVGPVPSPARRPLAAYAPVVATSVGV